MGQQGDTRYAEGNLMCFYCQKSFYKGYQGSKIKNFCSAFSQL